MLGNQVGASKFNDDGIVDKLYSIDGSYAVHPNIYLLGGFSRSKSETINSLLGTVDIRFNFYQLGAGYHTPITEKTDFLATIKYLNIESDSKLNINGMRVNR